MKLINGETGTFVLRFDRDEEVIQGIADFCGSKDIDAAWFSMIGACRSAIVSYWNLETREYEEQEIVEDLEVTGITGNVGLLDGKPIVHAHGTLANRKLESRGGHVRALVVSATMEVLVTALPGMIVRSADEKTGLNLMS